MSNWQNNLYIAVWWLNAQEYKEIQWDAMFKEIESFVNETIVEQ